MSQMVKPIIQIPQYIFAPRFRSFTMVFK
ncbi:Protein CBG25841 [Caenorhabditis briggsae]|uniref:Protein CBG25841 n=1 Tax=Caenorhabditis briggsae TaxID=6238 RepID=B6IHB2_CAEBR|nr:Protein CBG25841 [Caenorhabditis briggsae]CAR99292.1 Protein CBG25841 [Caenorhabditis briggsae]